MVNLQAKSLHVITPPLPPLPTIKHRRVVVVISQNLLVEVIAKNDNFSHYKVSDRVKYSRMNQVKFVEDSL